MWEISKDKLNGKHCEKVRPNLPMTVQTYPIFKQSLVKLNRSMN